MNDTVCGGAIAGAFGVRGDVRLKSFTAVPEDVAVNGSLSTEDGARTFEVSLSGKSTKGALVARLSGIASKEEVGGLRSTRLHVDRSRLPDLPEDEYYHADLIGLEVRDPGGARLGAWRQSSTTEPRRFSPSPTRPSRLWIWLRG